MKAKVKKVKRQKWSNKTRSRVGEQLPVEHGAWSMEQGAGSGEA